MSNNDKPVCEIVALPPIGYELIDYCQDIAYATGKDFRQVLREKILEKLRRMASRRNKHFQSLVDSSIMRHWINRQYIWSYVSWEYDEYGHFRKYRRVDPRQVAWYHRLTPLQKTMLHRACKKHDFPMWKVYYYGLELLWVREVIRKYER